MVVRFRTTSSSRCGTAITSDHVQITAAETVGVEHPAVFMRPQGRCATWCEPPVPLLTMTAMEAAISFDADQVRK